MKGETKKHNNKELTQQPLNVVNDDTAEGRLVRIIKNLKWFQTENAHVHNTKQTNCSKRQHEQEAQMLRQLTFKTRKYGFFFYVHSSLSLKFRSPKVVWSRKVKRTLLSFTIPQLLFKSLLNILTAVIPCPGKYGTAGKSQTKSINTFEVITYNTRTSQ